MNNLKFSIQSRNDSQSNELKELAKNYLQDFGLILDEVEPDIVISIGGDGTLLHAFHNHVKRLDKVLRKINIRLLNIHYWK